MLLLRSFIISTAYFQFVLFRSSSGEKDEGILTIAIEPPSGWIDYSTTNASVTFSFSPPCPDISVYKHGVSPRGTCVLAMGRNVCQPAVTWVMWQSSIYDKVGAWIRVRGATTRASGRYYGLCSTTNVSYTTQSPDGSNNLAIGVNPRILRMQVREGYNGYNLVRSFSSVSTECDQFFHNSDVRVNGWTFFLAFGVGKGLNKPTRYNSSKSLSSPYRLNFVVPQFELSSGKYYPFITRRQSSITDNLRGVSPDGEWIRYRVDLTKLAAAKMCSIEGYAMAHLPGAPKADVAKFNVSLTYPSRLASITVERQDLNSKSCNFSCNLFSCPPGVLDRYSYKWAFYYDISATRSAYLHFVPGNDPSNPERFVLDAFECQKHYHAALKYPSSYKVYCKVYAAPTNNLKFDSSALLYDLLRPCGADEFQCTNLECIALAKKCNGHKDCSNGADEWECKTEKCKLGEFQCPGDGKCLPMAMKCDSVYHCTDMSDEENCTSNAVKTPCPVGFFICANGRCIRRRYVCDSENDCGDNSDEAKCGSDSLYDSCTKGYFHCSNNRCVPASSVCSDGNNCGDNSDELDCGIYTSTICGSAHWQCDNGKCVGAGDLCDGRRDCSDGSDEFVCSERPLAVKSFLSTTVPLTNSANKSCSDGEYSCRSRQKCVKKSRVCDSMNDCGDWSDESKDICGFNLTKPCPLGTIKCTTFGNCLPQASLCNGVVDCCPATYTQQSETENKTHIDNCEKTDEIGCNQPVPCQCSSSSSCIPAWSCSGVTLPATAYDNIINSNSHRISDCRHESLAFLLVYYCLAELL